MNLSFMKVGLLLFIALISCNSTNSKENTTIAASNDYVPSGKYEKLDIEKDDRPGYNFSLSIKKFANKPCLLARYYGDRKLYHDTAIFDAKGKATFKGDRKKQGGMYIFVMPDTTIFDILITDDQHFSIETEGPNYLKNMKVDGNVEIEVFLNDIAFISEQRKKFDPLQKELRALQKISDSIDITNDSIEIRNKMTAIDNEVKDHRNKLTQQYADLFFAQMLLASENPTIPEQFKDSSDKWKFEYQHKHYWDGFDFNNTNFLYTDVWDRKITDYTKNWTYQSPDSQITAMDYILTRVNPKGELFEYTLRKFLNIYASSKIMCMEKCYVHLVDKYYSTGLAHWMPPESLKGIEKDASFMRHNLCGNVARELVMDDNTGNKRSLHKTQAKYILAFFWETSCGHCKKVAPIVYRLREVYAPYGFEVFAVATDTDVEDWKKVIKERKFNNWINCIDPEQKSAYKFLYGVRSTPRMFLLNEDREIIAKKLTVGQFAQFLDRELDVKHSGEFLKKDKELGTDYLNDDTK